MLGIGDSCAKFCARFDLSLPRAELEGVVEQILQAAANSGHCGLTVLGYGELHDAYPQVRQVAELLGPTVTFPSLITDGHTTWAVDEEEYVLQCDDPASTLAAEAVYNGMPITRGRREAVAPVELHERLGAETEELCGDQVAGLGAAGRLDVLGAYVESMEELSPFDALFLALTLADEECAAAVLARLSEATAEAMWPNLAAARRVAPPEAEATVVALLGFASYLSGRGAAHSSCLQQLQRINPRHPIGQLLVQVHREAIPPRHFRSVLLGHAFRGVR